MFGYNADITLFQAIVEMFHIIENATSIPCTYSDVREAGHFMCRWIIFQESIIGDFFPDALSSAKACI